jgi:hypothetical protein
MRRTVELNVSCVQIVNGGHADLSFIVGRELILALNRCEFNTSKTITSKSRLSRGYHKASMMLGIIHQSPELTNTICPENLSFKVQVTVVTLLSMGVKMEISTS